LSKNQEEEKVNEEVPTSFIPNYEDYEPQRNSLLNKILRKFTMRKSSGSIAAFKEVKGTSILNAQCQQ